MEILNFFGKIPGTVLLLRVGTIAAYRWAAGLIIVAIFSAVPMDAGEFDQERVSKLIEKAHQSVGKEDYRKAFRLFEKALKISENESPEAAFGLAQTSILLARFEDAKKAAETLLSLVEENTGDNQVLRAHAWNVLGITLYREHLEVPMNDERWKASLLESKHAFSETLRLTGGLATQVHFNLAEILSRFGQDENALNHLQRYRDSLDGREEEVAVAGLECTLRHQIESEGPKIRNMDDIIEPRGTWTPSPKMPILARRNGVQGTIFLRAIIDEKGNLVCVRALNGLPLGLTESALETVSQWRFEPAKLISTGEPVLVHYQLKVNFKLVAKEDFPRRRRVGF